MYDLEAHLDHRPGELARLGETLGAAEVGVEGGGMFVVGGLGVAHFLVEDGPRAAGALRDEGLAVVACRPVVTSRLRQDQPGQLGRICRAMAGAGITIETLYSDHDGQLILLVDDPGRAQPIGDDFAQP